MQVITERELTMLLGGEAVAKAAGHQVFCQSVEIGACSDEGFLEKMKCLSRRHQPEALLEFIDSWRPSVQKIYLKTLENTACPVCGDKEYIEAKTREGKMLAMSALVFHRYAGIQLPVELCKQLLRVCA